MKGLSHHLWLMLKLNMRQPQALIFGYMVPLLFLIAFGSVFGATAKEMERALSKVLVIAMLGSACFGLPIHIVSEREKGIWRRYWVTPTGGWSVMITTILARLILMFSSALWIIAVAMIAYDLPEPQYPMSLLIAYGFGSLAFIGLGLAISTLANSVSAVQAMGQCIFLPMLMIGGVAVPLRLLPDWAFTVSGYMPGRPAVKLIDLALIQGIDVSSSWFSMSSLMAIGLAGAWAFFRTPRWESYALKSSSLYMTALMAISAWLAMGLARHFGGWA
jgi:ABC-type multidrug transport system permease subunit